MRKVLGYAGIILGSFLFAFGLNYFIIANELAEGGFTGLALILHYTFGFSVGTTILVLNIPLFLVGLKLWGWDFAFKTVFGVVSVSMAIELTSQLQHHTGDLLLAALYGGVFTGLGLGIVFRSGGNTGGSDIIARLINHYTGVSLGKIMFAIDVVILTLVAILFGLEIALYTLVAVFIASRMIDLVQEGLDEAKAAMIICSNPQEVTKSIIEELDRSATILQGKGGYTGNDKEIVYCVVSKWQLNKLKQIVYKVDSRAFVIITSAHEVLGEGFREQ